MKRFNQVNKDEDANLDNRPQPLRQFSDGPSEPPSAFWEHFKAIAYWGLPLLVLLFIVIAGLYLVLSDASTNKIANPRIEDAPKEAASAQPIPSLASRKISEPAALLDAYLDAIGGQEAVERIESVRYVGNVVIEGVTKPFRMFLLSPDKGMLATYERSGAAVKYKLNGDKAWLELEQEDGSRQVKALDKEQVDAFKWSFQVNHTFRRMALARQTEGLAVDEIDYRELPCYRVTKLGAEDPDFEAILEKKNLRLLKTSEQVNFGGGQLMEVMYDDYKMVSGVMEAHTTQLYRDGVLESTVKVDTTRFNLGMITPLYSVPDEIED